jgi:hypothetical protein
LLRSKANIDKKVGSRQGKLARVERGKKPDKFGRAKALA